MNNSVRCQRGLANIVNQIGFYPQTAGLGPAEFLGVPGPFFADGRAPVEVDFPLGTLCKLESFYHKMQLVRETLRSFCWIYLLPCLMDLVNGDRFGSAVNEDQRIAD